MNLLTKSIFSSPVLPMLLLPLPAAAQFASPLQSGGGQAGAASPAPQIAVPQGNTIPSYQPVVLDGPDTSALPAAAQANTAPAIGSAQAAISPPTEFEAYVSAIAGKPLRRFGSELLVPGARDFTVPATASVPLDYRMKPGDQVQLGLTGSVQANNLRLTIDPSGRIFVPRIGAVQIGGVRFGDLKQVISSAIYRQYRGFELEVSVANLHALTIYATGFPQNPGGYTVGGLSTLVNAALGAGGPSAGGSFRSIQLRRGGKTVSDFDFYDLLLRGDTSGDVALQNGDVLYIAPAGDEVAIIGSVNREGIYEVAPGETLRDVLLYAGGTNTVADSRRLLIHESHGGGSAGWREISATEAAARPVRRGEIIRVLTDVGIARPIGQQHVLVTLSGEVARPGRYYVQPGTRLSDVVEKAGGLTSDAFPYASVITRESVKAQQRESFNRAVNDMELLLSTQPLVSADRSRMANPSNISLINSVIEKMRDREPTGRLVFGLPVSAATLPSDLVVENNDSVHVPTRPVTVGVFGAVPSPASFAYRDNATIGDFVRTAGGIQKLGDRKELFVVRANGTVLADGKRTLKAPALPGDLIFVPVEANRGEFWSRLRDITGSLFGGLVGAASLRTLVE